jgi:ethanolamine utilization protein EutQ (cupin superfamily)
MAKSYTIEEIRRDFLFVRTDIEQLEQTLGCIFQVLAKVIKQRRQDTGSVIVSREVNQAKKQSRELVTQLSSIESRLMSSRSNEAALAVSSLGVTPLGVAPLGAGFARAAS